MTDSFGYRQCTVKPSSYRHHQASDERQRTCVSKADVLAEYSGDNIDGSGEGDDEWIVFDLEKLSKAGVTHIALSVNIYNYVNKPSFTFSQLEGAFFRAVLGARGEKQWATAKTVQYVDLDEMKSAGQKTAAVVAVFFIEDLKDALLPAEPLKNELNREITPGDVAASTELISMKQRLQELMELMKTGSMSSSERNELIQKKTEFQRLAKQRYEIVVTSQDVSCPNKKCTLANSLPGIADLFRRRLGTMTDAKEKASEANQIIRNDLDSQDTVNDIDNFLASLDEMIPPNDQLGQHAGMTVVDRQGLAMSEQHFNENLLLEFPGGPPGADVLCLTRR
jgi:hypothetical protein